MGEISLHGEVDSERALIGVSSTRSSCPCESISNPVAGDCPSLPEPASSSQDIVVEGRERTSSTSTAWLPSNARFPSDLDHARQGVPHGNCGPYAETPTRLAKHASAGGRSIGANGPCAMFDSAGEPRTLHQLELSTLPLHTTFTVRGINNCAPDPGVGDLLSLCVHRRNHQPRSRKRLM